MKDQNISLTHILANSLLLTIYLLMTGMVNAGSIEGTAHDLVTSGFSGGENCIVCHTPHNSDTSIIEAPIWNHEFTTNTFNLYSADRTNATRETHPTGASKLCLSCHDGVTAIDKFGGISKLSVNSGNTAAISSIDMTKGHPLSVTFDRALAAKDPSFYDPSKKTVTIGAGGKNVETGTIAELLLPDGKVQCSSCHDVHNNFVGPGSNNQPFLRVSKAGSQICLTCHKK